MIAVGSADLACLWRDLGEVERAKAQALAYFTSAVNDGMPHVYHYELAEARALLEKLSAPVPAVPVYDPARDPELPYERMVKDLIAGWEKEGRKRWK